MPLIEDVIAAAPQLASEVVRRWASLSDSLPWGEGDLVDEDHLADLIRQLGESALARGAGGEPSRELILTALRHGRERRSDGFTEGLLFREYHLLRRGIWEELKRKDRQLASETIVKIDGEITLATNASLHGFHLEATEMSEEDIVNQIAERFSTG